MNPLESTALLAFFKVKVSPRSDQIYFKFIKDNSSSVTASLGEFSIH